jgi:hypothetical protein
VEQRWSKIATASPEAARLLTLILVWSLQYVPDTRMDELACGRRLRHKLPANVIPIA